MAAPAAESQEYAEEDRSYQEAYRLRQDGSQKAMDALFVDRGSLRAQRRMIDKNTYTDFLEAQLLRLSKLLIAADKKAEEREKTRVDAELKLEEQVSEMHRKFQAHEKQEAEVVFAQQKTEAQSQQVIEEPRGSRRTASVQTTMPEKRVVVVARKEKGANEEKRKEKEVSTTTTQTTNKQVDHKRLALSVRTLEKRIDEIQEDNKEKFLLLHRVDSRLQRIEKMQSKMLIDRLEQKCNALAVRIERTQIKAQEAVETTSRHAEERAELLVNAISALEDRMDSLQLAPPRPPSPVKQTLVKPPPSPESDPLSKYEDSQAEDKIILAQPWISSESRTLLLDPKEQAPRTTKLVKRKKKKSSTTAITQSKSNNLHKKKKPIVSTTTTAWPRSVMHTGPLPRSHWIPAARVNTPRNLSAPTDSSSRLAHASNFQF